VNVSGIEWLYNGTEKGLTVNPSIGCSRISPGCGGGYIKGPNGEQGGCWAEELVSTRMSKNPKLPMYHDLAREGGGWSGIVKLVPERLKEIVALGKARKRVGGKRVDGKLVGGKLVPFASRVFVCDLSDLFHDDVPFEYIAAVFGAMACAPKHLFYVLTKRPARAVEFAKWVQEAKDGPTQFCADTCATYDPSTHAGDLVAAYAMVRSVYSQADALGRCPTKDEAIAGAKPYWPLPNVAFGVTVEDRRYGVPRLELARQFPARYHWASVEPLLEDLGIVDFTGVDLAVVGAESGNGYRPFDEQWARNVKASCDQSGTRFFWKQGPGGDTDLVHAPIDLCIRENLPMP
jgi:protein gp37